MALGDKIYVPLFGIDNSDASQAGKQKMEQRGKERGIFKSPFSKGGFSRNRVRRSSVISYPSRIESTQLSYGDRQPYFTRNSPPFLRSVTAIDDKSKSFSRLLFVIGNWNIYGSPFTAANTAKSDEPFERTRDTRHYLHSFVIQLIINYLIHVRITQKLWPDGPRGSSRDNKTYNAAVSSLTRREKSKWSRAKSRVCIGVLICCDISGACARVKTLHKVFGKRWRRLIISK